MLNGKYLSDGKTLKQPAISVHCNIKTDLSEKRRKKEKIEQLLFHWNR